MRFSHSLGEGVAGAKRCEFDLLGLGEEGGVCTLDDPVSNCAWRRAICRRISACFSCSDVFFVVAESIAASCDAKGALLGDGRQCCCKVASPRVNCHATSPTTFFGSIWQLCATRVDCSSAHAVLTLIFVHPPHSRLSNKAEWHLSAALLHKAHLLWSNL